MKRIFLSGVATSGKDEFALQAIEFFKSKGLKAKRFALADNLKLDMSPFLYDSFGIDIFNCSKEDKEIVRPLLVAFGCAKRKTSQGKYWINFIENDLRHEEIYGDSDIAIITDIRFAEYEEDEALWASETGTLIHITRIENGAEIQPANEEERRNDPRLSKFASIFIKIETMQKDRLYTYIHSFLDRHKQIWE